MDAQNRFNPFTDRQSRDIRNELSSALAIALRDGNDQPITDVAQKFLSGGLAEIHSAYINERLRRYRKAIDAIAGKIDDPFHRSFILWDLGLFFEMHEVLEHDWYHATGETKLLMQALIRAAGVYIKLECDLVPQARKIAAKALPVLQAQQKTLAAYFPPERLIAALASESATPPKLLASN